MSNAVQRRQRRFRRKRGLRQRAFGTPTQPRLTIFRSNKHMYAQVVDDLQGKTIAAASTAEKAAKVAPGANVASAQEVGKRIAGRVKEAGIDSVTFDRNGYRYHGRVKALADAAREAGLKF